MDIKRWVEMLAINVSANKRSIKARAESQVLVQRSKEIMQRSVDRIESAIKRKKKEMISHKTSAITN